MTRSTTLILKDIIDIAYKYACMHVHAMGLCQEWVFNGFKRYHKMKAEKFFCIVIKLKAKSYDYYSAMIKPDYIATTYEPANIIRHFQMWLSMVEGDLQVISNLSKEFCEATGFEAPYLSKIHKMLMKEAKKLRRRLTRFKQIGSEATGYHDLHRIDDELHKKLKEKKS